MNYDNIVDVAKVIQNAMIEYQEKFPDNLSEEKIRQYALGKVMRFTKGKGDPSSFMHLICLEKSVYTDSLIASLGLQQC